MVNYFFDKNAIIDNINLNDELKKIIDKIMTEFVAPV